MPLVYTKCCICIPLRAGSLIVGYLNLVLLTCFMTPFIYSIANEDSTVHHIGFKPQKSSWTSAASPYVILVGLIIFWLFTVLLLIGIHGNKRRLVKAYLVYNVVFIAAYMIGFFSQIGSINMTMVVNDLGVICVTMNYWLIIRSYYITTEKEVEPDTEESDSPGSPMNI